MTTCLVGFISLLGSLSCSGPDPIGPRQDTLRPGPMLAVGSAGPCARVHVQIVGGTTAQASFAADSGCATGLALVGAGAVGYVKNQRKVSIPVRVVNRGPGGRDAPILVVLPRDSGVVTAPSTVTARVVEANADSVGGGGGAEAGVAFWTLLESGGTITGDSTSVRTLQLVVPSKTTAARLAFEIRADLPDSALPLIVSRLNFPAESLYAIADSILPEWTYYRRVIGVFLKPGTDGIAFRAFLEKYQGTVVGGGAYTGDYAILFPDHGNSWVALKAFLDSLHSEPIVRVAGPLGARGPKSRLDGARYPREGGGIDRQSWIDGDGRLWAQLTIRAPLAWSCENGRYGSTAPPVALVEGAAPATHSDLASISAFVAPYVGSPSGPQGAADTIAHLDSLQWHASKVGSLVAGEADNGIGISGLIWGGSVRYFGLGVRNFLDFGTSVEALAEHVLPRLEAEGPSIVNSTVSVGISNDSAHATRMRDAFRRLFNARPDLIWVQASGNRSYSAITSGALRNSPQEFSLIHRVLVDLREESTTYRDQIYLVGGTQVGNTRAIFPSGTEAVEIIGHTEIAAPARNVPGSLADGSPELGDGTSFAAPLVTGTIALLRAADPALTPARIRELILDGARVPSRDSMTGLLVAPAPVAGFQGQVYELDTFGALALLADERPNSPPCGNQLVTTTPDSVVALRDLERTRSIRVQGARWLTARPSASPGGRVLSAWVQEDSLNPICPNCFSHSVATFDPSGARVLTWKDYSARHDADDVYVLQRVSAEKTLLEIRSQATNGLLASLYLRDEAGATTYLSPDVLRVHPQGRFAFGDFVFHDLRTGAATRFHPSDHACADDPTCHPYLFWDLAPDGSRLIALQGRRWVVGGVETGTEETLLEFRIEVGIDSSLAITGPRQTVVLPDDAAGLPSYGVEGRVVYTVVHEGGDTCTYQVRPAAALGTVAETRSGLPCPVNRAWQMGVRALAAGGGR